MDRASVYTDDRQLDLRIGFRARLCGDSAVGNRRTERASMYTNNRH